MEDPDFKCGHTKYLTKNYKYLLQISSYNSLLNTLSTQSQLNKQLAHFIIYMFLNVHLLCCHNNIYLIVWTKYYINYKQVLKNFFFIVKSYFIVLLKMLVHPVIPLSLFCKYMLATLCQVEFPVKTRMDMILFQKYI